MPHGYARMNLYNSMNLPRRTRKTYEPVSENNPLRRCRGYPTGAPMGGLPIIDRPTIDYR